MSLGDIYQNLKESLLSHSQSLRLNVLRIFSSPVVTKSPEEREVIKRCLQCENISIDVQGSRERALWVGRLPQIIPDGRSVASEIATSWLLCKYPRFTSQTCVDLTPTPSSVESKPTTVVGSDHEGPVRTLKPMRSRRLVSYPWRLATIV